MRPNIEIAELLQGRTYLFLNELLAWGGAVLDEVYGDEPDAWAAEGGVTLRFLARGADISVSTLYRYLAITQMWRRCGEPELYHLGSSHMRELLPLHTEDQLRLMIQAEKEQWPVARIRQLAARCPRREDAAGRGRPPKTPGYITAIEHIESWIESEHHLRGLDYVHRVEVAEAQRLLRTVCVARRELALIEERLRDNLQY